MGKLSRAKKENASLILRQSTVTLPSLSPSEIAARRERFERERDEKLQRRQQRRLETAAALDQFYSQRFAKRFGGA